MEKFSEVGIVFVYLAIATYFGLRQCALSDMPDTARIVVNS